MPWAKMMASRVVLVLISPYEGDSVWIGDDEDRCWKQAYIDNNLAYEPESGAMFSNGYTYKEACVELIEGMWKIIEVKL